ncbi:hypothetical protein HF086_010534 [Spodoptera exigua]|uniref:Metalloendopeptidase n=1 Tax=Spodoptera exigua TaxID=7107 RepID=A0A922MUN6_SPOEX|nr:hypothetical protein HF086_010534 [Spodoptera exigua]
MKSDSYMRQTFEIPMSLDPPSNKSVSETDVYSDSAFPNELTISQDDKTSPNLRRSERIKNIPKVCYDDSKDDLSNNYLLHAQSLGRSDGCYANVGYWSTMGVHTLNLARDTPGRGCFTHTVIIHEWLHVVGFFHMQSTHNRDTYVRIMWQNIWPGMEHNFDKYATNIVNNMGLPYEYASNMHYGRYGFSINGQATMLPIFVRAWNDVINPEDLSKGGYEFEPNYEELEDLPVDDQVAEEIAPQEEVVEDIPQEDIVADKVTFVDEAPQELDQ